ncbi:AfsR/SARP family transcriptional regulator [Stackebrandtia nassauensis]|uniref:Transcriptional regulator, SARP family n=1 Tax=Stackebrandtia nassauensis (strain DSM 44728 / CIP 108903 / NRRL B-16338 / NBRC 102104 / LLR-40K-21) TaxID=446470 RepID=D3PZU2_STANL|nr:BTAD domain-containing putative transcriptional regulator [Stackebrandtia nassauensis]ADD43629.1 transcriptional regulator, SARP family [Stackebrandtia nassauensis DSM 44728]
MFLSVLGPLTADIDGQDVPVPAGMQRLLLAALLHRVRRPVSIDTLAEALWPDETPTKPDKAIQLYVHRLRKLLGDPGRIIHGPAGYSLIASRSELDWQCFEDLLRTAREARHAGSWDTATHRYVEALALWRSDPYEDVPGCHLLTPEIQRLTSLRVEARVEQAEVMVDRGRHVEAEPVISRLLSEFPHREGLYALLMLAYYRAGRVGEALDVYRTAQRLLADELGVDPGPKLNTVHRAILNRSPGLDGTAAAPASPVPAQLPAPISALAGREAEIEELTRADTPGRRGLVRAVDGMAGVGKSTLAIAAAHRLAPRYPDGQLFADLRGFTPGVEPSQPGEVLGRLLEGLGVTGDRLPHDTEARAGLWRGMSRGKRILLLLDNAVDANQLRPLLPADPGCLAIVTSRRRLTDLDDVRNLTLDVLPKPAAVQLFTNVVGASRLSDQEALDEVLASCGGLPLALRLTASRFRDRPSWTLSQLAERLRRDRPEVLSSDGVASAFGIAYERLSDERRRLFRRLSLHPGVDIGSAAAAALAESGDAENELEALVDTHLLLSPDFGRYRFHDLMRRYAESLVTDTEPAADREAALRRLTDHYLGSTRNAVEAAGLAPALPTTGLASGSGAADPGEPSGHAEAETFPDAASALSWLDTERANLVAVTRRAAEHGWTDHVVALATLLARYLSAGTHAGEELTVHRLAARMAAERGDTPAQAIAWHHLGGTYLALGQRDKALAYYGEALVVFQETGDDRAEAVARHAVANALDMGDQLVESLEHRERALELATKTADAVGQCRAHLGLAISLRRLGRYPASGEHCQRALDIAVEAGHHAYHAAAHEHLGHLRLACREYPAAVEAFEQALDRYRDSGNRRGEYQSLNGLGRSLCALGEIDAALEHQRQAMDIVRDTDDPNAKLEGHLWLGEALAAAGQPRDARRHLDTALELAAKLGQPEDERQCRALLATLDR